MKRSFILPLCLIPAFAIGALYGRHLSSLPKESIDFNNEILRASTQFTRLRMAQIQGLRNGVGPDEDYVEKLSVLEQLITDLDEKASTPVGEQQVKTLEVRLELAECNIHLWRTTVSEKPQMGTRE